MSGSCDSCGLRYKRPAYRRGKSALGFLGVYTSVRAAFSLTEREESRGEPEASQRTVPPELSRPGKCDMHNKTLVPIARAYTY